MTLIDKILVYLWNKSSQIEKEYQDTLNHQRYRSLDENDYLENIIQKVRRDTFNEFVFDMMSLFKLDRPKGSSKPTGKK